MGNEIRKDYLLDRWVIIASNRGKRPEDFKKKKGETDNGKVCSFCAGNEHLTPPEISRVDEDGGWIIRCFPNLYPATHKTKAKGKNGFFTYVPAYGRHEVIVETPKHDGLLHKLSLEHLTRLLGVYQERIDALNALRGVGYTLVFKNMGNAAGASLSHTHTQVVSLPRVPTLVREEAEKSFSGGKCVFCKVLEKELESERRVFEDENVGAYTPYASRFPFEVWIQPKRHLKSIGEMNHDERLSFAKAMKYILGRINESMDHLPYNFYLHTSPAGKSLHFHMEFCPKISTLAGFELGSGMYLNIMPPEEAAKFYRGEKT